MKLTPEKLSLNKQIVLKLLDIEIVQRQQINLDQLIQLTDLKIQDNKNQAYKKNQIQENYKASQIFSDNLALSQTQLGNLQNIEYYNNLYQVLKAHLMLGNYQEIKKQLLITTRNDSNLHKMPFSLQYSFHQLKGKTYKELQDYRESQKSFVSAYNIVKTQKNVNLDEVCELCLNIVESLLWQFRFQEGIAYCNEFIPYFQQNMSIVQYSQMIVLKAKIWLHQNKPVSSLDLLKQAFEIRKKDIKSQKDTLTSLDYNKKLILIAETSNLISQSYLQTQNYKLSEKFFNESNIILNECIGIGPFLKQIQNEVLVSEYKIKSYKKQYQQALQIQFQVYENFKKTLGELNIKTIKILFEIGITYRRMLDIKQSDNYIHQYLENLHELKKKPETRQFFQTDQIQLEIINASIEYGDYEYALDISNKILDQNQKYMPENYTLKSEIYYLISKIYEKLAEISLYKKYAKQAVDSYRHLLDFLEQMPDFNKLEYDLILQKYEQNFKQVIGTFETSELNFK